MGDFPEQNMRNLVSGFLKFYVPSNPDNYTRKPIKDWTAADLKEVGNRDLDALRTILQDEQYKITDALLPKGMSREDFYHAIVREEARRSRIQNDYIEPLLTKPEQRTQQVTLQRTAFGVPNAVPQEVRDLAGVVALRDAAVDMIINNPSELRIQKDWADSVGLNSNIVLPVHTDVRAYDFGYTVGSMPQYRNNNALNITASSPLQPAEVQEKYCPVVHNIFQEGTAYLNRDNFLTGFIQARIDARTNFEPVTEHVGLFAQCEPPIKETSLTAEEKREVRANTATASAHTVSVIQRTFTLTKPPYTQESAADGTRYLKSWQMWDKDDLSKIDRRVMMPLYMLASTDDFDNLKKVLPNSYKGNIQQFASDIMEACKARGMVEVSMTTNIPEQGQNPKALAMLEDAAKKAGNLPNILMDSAHVVLPAMAKSANAAGRAA